MLMFELLIFMFELLPMLILLFDIEPFDIEPFDIELLPVEVEPLLPVEVEPLFMFVEFMFEFIIMFVFLLALLLALLAVPGSQAMLIAPKANTAERAKVFFILKSISCLLKKLSVYYFMRLIGRTCSFNTIYPRIFKNIGQYKILK